MITPPFACDDQRAFPESRRDPFELSESSGAEDDAPGGGEFETSHQPPSIGNTLTYFTLLRSSAIIGATVSRHVA